MKEQTAVVGGALIEAALTQAGEMSEVGLRKPGQPEAPDICNLLIWPLSQGLSHRHSWRTVGCESRPEHR